MSLTDLLTLISVFSAILFAVIGGVWMLARSLSAGFGKVHERIDEVVETTNTHHLEVTTRLTKLEVKVTGTDRHEK